jgi:hypothetical protein
MGEGVLSKLARVFGLFADPIAERRAQAMGGVSRLNGL